MKKFSKIVSLILSVVIIMGALPIFSVSADDGNPESFDVIIATGEGTTGDSSDKCYFPEVTYISVENLPDDQKDDYPEGKLMAFYFCHTQHVTDTSNTDINAYGGDYVTVSADSGKTWSKPKAFLTPEWALQKGLTTEDAPREPRDPVVFQMDEGKTLVASFPIGSATGGTRSYYITSVDAGESWSEPKLFECTFETTAGEELPYYAQQYKPAIFDNGDVLFPFYTSWSNKDSNGNHLWTTYCTFGIRYSWDTVAKTFTTKLEEDGKPFAYRVYDYDETDADGNKIEQVIMNECSFVATNNPEKPGQVFALSREYGNFYESLDYGKTWQCVTVEKTSTGAIAQPYLNPLPDGSIMLSYARGSTTTNVGGRWAYAKRFYPELGYKATETKLIYKNDMEMGYAATALLGDGDTMIVVSYDTALKAIVGNFISISDFAPGDSSGRFCGFESYPEGDNPTHYNNAVSNISFDDYHSGIKSLKTTLQEKGITAFEVRDRYPVEIAKDTEYTLNFFYKSDKSVSVYAGLGTKENLKNTAYGLSGINLSATNEWTEASIIFTPDKASKDGYALAMILYAGDGAEIYIDDISVSFNESGNASSMAPIEFDDSWYPELLAFNGVTQTNIWDGSTYTAPTYNETEGVYEITNGAELAYIIKNGGGAGNTYKLKNDVFLNEISGINWSTGEVVGSYSPRKWNFTNVAFQGNIDGDGHTVYGLYSTYGGSYNGSYLNWGVGLIPKVAAGTSVLVKNLAVDYSFLDNECSTSAFVGWTEDNRNINLEIENCFAGANVTLKGGTTGAICGVARATTTIKNCYTLANCLGTTRNGFFGSVQNGVISVSGCYNANGPMFHTNAGNPDHSQLKITNCYSSATDRMGAVTVLELSNMIGSDVLKNSAKMAGLSGSGVYTAVTRDYPVLSVFLKEESGVFELWDGNIAESFANGSGTSDDPYLITNGKEFALAINSGGGADSYYKLANDIYLNDIKSIDWSTGKAIGSYSINSWYYGKTFEGTIDGAGHKVYGLYINTNPSVYEQWDSNKSTGAALIPSVPAEKTVSVFNIGVDYTYINYGYTSSAIVGNAYNANANVESCYAGNNVFLNSANAGALVGSGGSDNKINITNCYSLATTNGTLNHGLLAYANMVYPLTVKNSYNLNGPIVSYVANDWTTRYTYINSYYTEENGTTKNGQTKTGSALISKEKMLGNDVLSSSDKMANLGAAFVVGKRDFAENDCLVYLPAGTNLGDDYKPTFYDFDMSVISNSEAVSGYVMKRGAFVKFGIMPDETTVVVPAPFKAGTQQTTDEIKASATLRVPTPSDLTGDKAIDIRDLVALRNNINTTKSMASDVDKNGKLDNNDFANMRSAIIGK